MGYLSKVDGDLGGAISSLGSRGSLLVGGAAARIIFYSGFRFKAGMTRSSAG